MTEELSQLKNMRGGHKGRITFYYNKLNSETFQDSQLDIEFLFEQLKISYSKYMEIHSKIEALDPTEIAKIENFEFEENYIKIVREFREKLDHYSNDKKNIQHLDAQSDIKLPDLDLPKFNGEELDWISFRDVFLDLVHNNLKHSNTSKMRYLMKCLKGGKAFHFVESLAITNENYSTAWSNLYSHYNNLVAIQKIHMDHIFNIKKPIENSSRSLTEFVKEIEKHFNALNSLGVSIFDWNLFYNSHILNKLDNSSKIELLKETPHDKLLGFEEIMNILKKRARILKSISVKDLVDHKPSTKFIKTAKVFAVSNIICSFCSGSHNLEKCEKFTHIDFTPRQRHKFIKKKNLCTNCLNKFHNLSDCPAKVCDICQYKHHTLLHFGNSNNRKKTDFQETHSNNVVDIITDKSNDDGVASSLHVHNRNNEFSENSQILLATAIVNVKTCNEFEMKGRALLDSGSQFNFISERFAQLLKCPRNSTDIPISGINQKLIRIKYKVYLNIQSLSSNYNVNLEFLVIPKITNYLPTFSIPFDIQSLPSSLILADSKFYASEKIDLLIGAEIYNSIILDKAFKIINELPPFQNTVFGHIVSGKVNCQKNVCMKVVLNDTSDVETLNELKTKVQKFWEFEQLTSKSRLSISEKHCEAHYEETTKRNESGRYVVALPVTNKIKLLGESRITALKQFHYLEKKLDSNPDMKQQYINFMTEYIDLGHMSLVEEPHNITNPYGKEYFLPHHCVYKESSSTTKLRVVFNASAKSSTNVSLNDCLLQGPTIQSDLFSLIIRFRKHNIAFSADITKMYRQILISDKDQDLQKIWWRNNSNESLKCYKLNTVTYGTTSAPYLAIKTLFRLANDERRKFPIASNILENDFYVDDVLSGAKSEEEALHLKNELIHLLSLGGFELRKWASNSLKLSSTEENLNSDVITVLGLSWDTVNDELIINLRKFDESKLCSNVCTKRSVLSEIATLFDPLGLCGPTIFLAKLFLQSIWSLSKLEWDDPLPYNMCSEWNNFKSEINNLGQIKIIRHLGSDNAKLIELHGFGDASTKGYGAVVYVRVLDQQGNYKVNIICSKSRVAPLKTQTVPRLELCASVLLAQLMEKTIAALKIKFNKIYYWTDSEITLYRINSEPNRFSMFVANRISLIQELSNPKDWYYIRSEENPADLLSRGVLPNLLKTSIMWWHGPNFLQEDDSQWPISKPKIDIVESNLEIRKTKLNSMTVTNEYDIFARFSKFNVLVRVISFCRRFIKNCRLKKQKEDLIYGPVTTCEFRATLTCLIKVIQGSEFHTDISCLKKGKLLNKSSRIISLSPFIDDDCVLRVGGRLKNAKIDYNQKYPILLPSKHKFTELLVESEHLRLLHIGPQSLLYNLRLEYWIIGGRSLCKKIVRTCISCYRNQPKKLVPYMGNLPENRVNPSRPFTHVGIDLCGPFNLTPQFRSKITLKSYVAIFICFASKAIHLEIVDNLSSESFLSTLRRFCARRGRPAVIYSDNGTNFIGCKTELINLQRLFNNELDINKLKGYFTEQMIEWQMIPARSPHFGGLWESAVKLTKYHLKRVVGTSNINIQHFYTLITQIESVLNSRPLQPMSEDPSDFSVLTPSHFLMGESINTLPQPSLSHLDFNRLSNYQRTQALFQEFWKRWSNEYLSEQQQRRKWRNDHPEIKLGSLVLLMEENVPPIKWIMGRIIKLHPGTDNKTRVVTIKTPTNTVKRSITKISVLPLNKNLEM